MSLAAEGSETGEAAPGGSAPPWRAALAGWATLAVFAATPLLAYLWNLGFAAVLALAGLVCVPLLTRDRRPSLGLIVLLGLTLWAVASAFWSVAATTPADFRSYKQVEQFTAIKLIPQYALYGAFVAGAAGVSGQAGRRATLALAIGLLAVSAVFLVDGAFKAPIYNALRIAGHKAAQRPDLALRDVSRTAYVVALLFWPAVLRLDQAGWRWAAVGLAAAMVVGAYLLGSDAPVAALALSGAVFAAVRFGGRPALFAFLAAVMLYFVAAPVLILLFDRGAVPHPGAGDIRLESWAVRVDIWRFAAQHIVQRPFFGWGLDASRTFSPDIPLHTHDAAIQLWLELGAVGAALACLFWIWVVARLDDLEARDRPAAAAAAAAAAAYLTIGALSFGVWQEWWLALGALTAAVCAALVRGRETPPEPRRTD